MHIQPGTIVGMFVCVENVWAIRLSILSINYLRFCRIKVIFEFIVRIRSAWALAQASSSTLTADTTKVRREYLFLGSAFHSSCIFRPRDRRWAPDEHPFACAFINYLQRNGERTEYSESNRINWIALAGALRVFLGFARTFLRLQRMFKVCFFFLLPGQINDPFWSFVHLKWSRNRKNSLVCSGICIAVASNG